MIVWRELVANSNETLNEFVKRLSHNLDQVSNVLVDLQAFHLYGSYEKSLKFATENSIVERNRLLVREYAIALESLQQLPKDWSSIAMVIASAPELNVAPKTLLRFCELAFAQDQESISAQQALAWTLYRNAEWTECIPILDTEVLRREPCNLYVLAMAQYQLGDKSKANQMWQEAELLKESQAKSTESVAPNFVDAQKIKRVALPRLQWEAKTLLGGASEHSRQKSK